MMLLKRLKIFLIMNIFSITLAAYNDPHCNIPSCRTKHILCKFDGVILHDHCFKKGWVSNAKLDKNEQDLILDIHNKLRSDIALGKRICNNKLLLKPSNRMFTLVYDGQLSFMAELWVRRCLEENDLCFHVGRFNIGTNRILHFVYNGSRMDALRDMLQLWINECIFFRPSHVSSFLRLSLRKADLIKNFTQMIWANTTRIGCAKAMFHEPPEELDEPPEHQKMKYKYWLLCLYGPEGLSGPKVYDIGPSCAKCPLDYLCINGLCFSQISSSVIHIQGYTLLTAITIIGISLP